MAKGKCPKCETVPAELKIDPIEIGVAGEADRKFKGASFLCPNCDTILGTGFDPVALRNNIVAGVIQQLKAEKPA